MKVRIEIHLDDKKEVKHLDKLAAEQGRSRKNFCETEIRKMIEEYVRKKQTGSNGKYSGDDN